MLELMSVHDALREVRLARERRDNAEALYLATHANFLATMRNARICGANPPAIAASANLSAQRVRRHLAGTRPAT